MTPPDLDLTLAQRGVRRGAIAATITAAVAIGATLAATPVIDAGIVERLGRVIRVDLALFACVIVAIASIASARFVSADDIDGSGGGTSSPLAARRRAVLANTLEQAVVAAPAQVALATLLPGQALALIPMLAALFVAGRLAFAAGYARGAPGRAFGFGLTFYPTVAAYLVAFVLIVSRA